MQDDSTEPRPNKRLAEDLGALYRANVDIPASLDEAVLKHAKTHLSGWRFRQRFLRIGALATAAAAMVVIAVHLWQPPATRDSAHSPVAIANRAPDIVDALKLARRIRAGQVDPAHDDVNHDGAVDQHDVDTIAMAAVRLPEARVQ